MNIEMMDVLALQSMESLEVIKEGNSNTSSGCGNSGVSTGCGS